MKFGSGAGMQRPEKKANKQYVVSRPRWDKTRAPRPWRGEVPPDELAAANASEGSSEGSEGIASAAPEGSSEGSEGTESAAEGSEGKEARRSAGDAGSEGAPTATGKGATPRANGHETIGLAAIDLDDDD